MNDEIKEILDILKNCKDYDDEVFLIKQHSATLLLDYITNLQQENYELKYINYGDNKITIEDCVNEMNNTIKELQQENETRQQDINNLTYQLAKMKEENERLKEENNNKAMNDYAHAIDESWYRELYDDYKSRCKKASELLKYYDPEPWSTYQITGEILLNLLNILQNGSEKNEC